MNDIVIQAENIGKRYRIGGSVPYKALRDTLTDMAALPLKLFRPHSRPFADKPDFWALKSVSFEVKRGEVVGVIGRNGAGKSTLLKILSRITEPTEGRIELRGRVGSLLEVGTGFHPELTGRENIYLNGAILGMKRAEIRRKFDEIVEFSEISKFLDTPVKHYSSGMYMRLAFSVAAHLEPEILLVDEVLAVGDAEFQKKCLGKMGEVARGGRTVLFVSHNMAAVQALCGSCLLLNAGTVAMQGNTREVVDAYLAGPSKQDQAMLGNRTDRQGSQEVRIRALDLYPECRGPGHDVASGEDCLLQISYENRTGRVIEHAEVAVGIYDSFGRALSFLENVPLHQELTLRGEGGVLRCRIPRLPLVPGDHYLNIHIRAAGVLFDWVQHAMHFTVHAGDFFGTGKLTHTALGGVFLQHEWIRAEK